ncbi:hypothetical protein GCM10009112_24120 [Marinomonas arenicola]|uniref:putative quinol monooxygenase n=1 Tax=Marinomonas TaxID=28253 RepID=UPI001056A3BA|nr:putative quinol monooxygenase [Marinomonas sp. KMM3893]
MVTENILLLVDINCKDNSFDLVLSALRECEEHSKIEQGCLRYDILLNNLKPLTIMIVEKWLDQNALDLHNKSKHFTVLQEKIKNIVESVKINTYR